MVLFFFIFHQSFWQHCNFPRDWYLPGKQPFLCSTYASASLKQYVPVDPKIKREKKCFKKTLKNMFADEHWQNKQFPVGKPIIFLTSVKNYYWHRHQILLRLLDEWKNVELSDFNNQTIKCWMLKITWKKK